MTATLTEYLDRLAAVRRTGTDEPFVNSVGADFAAQVRSAGLSRRAAELLVAHAAGTLLLLASWVLIGAGLLAGRVDGGWLLGWALALVTTVPLAAWSRRLEGVVGTGVAALLKRRVLAGAMARDVDQTRRRGVGSALAAMLDAQAIEQVGVAGGLHVLLAAFELAAVAAVLALGAEPALELGALAATLLAAALAMRVDLPRRASATARRLDLTRASIDALRAHRTRLAQQAPEHWHATEDEIASAYVASARSADGSSAFITAALPRIFVLLGIAALVPGYIDRALAIEPLAVTLGAVLYAALALERLGYGYARAAPPWLAWRALEPLFRAGAGSNDATNVEPLRDAEPLVRAQGLSYANRGGLNRVLEPASFAISRGDRVLLEGPTGSGKSTLAALLAGLRAPSAGYLLAGGFDRAAIGSDGWRRCVTVAPQYHENHIFSASLGFNLLLGRPLPHTAHDWQDAVAVCAGLGLGPLVARMPSGLNQMVGETGWRLSHGERGRVFLARALLQDTELVVLDESLAALDPENLHTCLGYVREQANTLVLIAHP